MKKYSFFIVLLALLASSCAVGTYMPHANNNYGTQTQVVLDKANFRVVRNVEAVVEVNNSNLKRRDVEKSAYGQLFNQYPLTGSQAFVNMSVEEVRREKKGGGKRKQYVAARATIIEFVKDNGEPVHSVAKPYTAPEESRIQVQEEEPVSVQPENTTTSNRSRWNFNRNKQQTTKPEDPSVQTAPVSSEAPAQTIEEEKVEEKPVPMASAEEAEKVLYNATKTIDRMKMNSIDSYQEYEKVFKEMYRRAKKNPTVESIDALKAVTVYVNELRNGIKDSSDIKQAYKANKDMNKRIELLVKFAKETN